MGDPISDLLVKIEAPGVDKNELADLERRLRGEIEQLDVESVQPVKGGDIPKGAMAGEWYEIGVLSIKMATAVLPPLILLIKSWLERQGPKAGAGRKETRTTDKWKIKIGLGTLSVEIDRDASKEEIADAEAQLRKQIEKK